MPELVEFFAALEANRLRYVVLRNYQQLPFHWGNDIDILSHPEDLAPVVSLLRQSFRLEKPSARYRRMERWQFLSFLIEGFDRPLQIDFYTSLSKAWLVYADTTVVLARTSVSRGGVRIPNPRDELELIAAKELFSYGLLREKYHADFHTRGRQFPSTDRKLFDGRLTPASISLIYRLLEEPNCKGRLWPTARTLLAPRRFGSWLLQRANGFS